MLSDKMDWDLRSWVSDFSKGVLVQLFSILFGIVALGMLFGEQHVLFQPAYSALQYPFESILNSIGIYFLIGWFIVFPPMTVAITEKEEIESPVAFFLGSFFIGVVLISLITGLFWGLMLSVIGVVIMYLIKVFSEHNELW
jgi:simple sugar transport system permease protein